MSVFPSNLASVTTAMRLWILCLAVLLATLPVAGYGNALPAQSASELDAQFETGLVVHDYQSRLAIVSDKRSQAESDADPVDALVVTTTNLPASGFLNDAVAAATQSTTLSRYRYFQPLLRAPPSF